MPARRPTRGVVYVHPGTWMTSEAERKAQFNRVDRAGQIRAGENVCGNLLEVGRFCHDLGTSVARTFGQSPAFDAALIHSEVCDGSELCFHEADRQAYRAARGEDAFAERGGVHGASLPRPCGTPAAEAHHRHHAAQR